MISTAIFTGLCVMFLGLSFCLFMILLSWFIEPVRCPSNKKRQYLTFGVLCLALFGGGLFGRLAADGARDKVTAEATK